MMQRCAKLLINEDQIDLDLSEVTAFRDHVMLLADKIHSEVITLEKARELIGEHGSIDEAIASKDGQINRLCGLALRFELGGVK